MVSFMYCSKGVIRRSKPPRVSTLAQRGSPAKRENTMRFDGAGNLAAAFKRSVQLPSAWSRSQGRAGTLSSRNNTRASRQSDASCSFKFPREENLSEVPLRPLRRSDRLLSSAARGIPLRDAMRRILAFDTEHVELDEWPVHVNEHWPNPSAIRRCCIWKRPVELAAVGSATAISPSPSLQFMRHSETVERDVQPLYPEKVREHCTTTRLA